MTPANLDALADALADLEQARATQRDLHRRAQKAESFRERHRGGGNWLLNSERKERFARRAAEARAAQLQAEVEAKDKLIAAMVEALKPFADDAARWDRHRCGVDRNAPWPDNMGINGGEKYAATITVGDLRAARTALAARAATAREGA